MQHHLILPTDHWHTFLAGKVIVKLIPNQQAMISLALTCFESFSFVCTHVIVLVPSPFKLWQNWINPTSLAGDRIVLCYNQYRPSYNKQCFQIRIHAEQDWNF